MTAAASLPLFQGGLMMAGLIVAIGALNANVLRRGLLRAHVWAGVAPCALSDGVLTVCGAAALSRWLARPAVWRAVDALIALVMAATAINLLRSS
jgi:L-lysine exporter family protein LysE/ArgO